MSPRYRIMGVDHERGGGFRNLNERRNENSMYSFTEKNLGKLLDETFLIYFRHFRRFVSLTASVQIPVSLITIVVLFAWGYTATVSYALFLLGSFGTVVAYSVVVYAVGQQYISGKIHLKSCYVRTWGRILSLVIYSICFSAVTFAIVLSITYASMIAIAIMLLLASTTLIVYMSMSVQSVVVEGYKTLGALKRSFDLMRGKWWRVFGNLMIIGLVATGLGIVVSIPVSIPMVVFSMNPGSEMANYVQSVGGLVVRTFVLPIMFIFGTLLYYDLRVRGEGFNSAKLAEEMGLVDNEFKKHEGIGTFGSDSAL